MRNISDTEKLAVLLTTAESILHDHGNKRFSLIGALPTKEYHQVNAYLRGQGAEIIVEKSKGYFNDLMRKAD